MEETRNKICLKSCNEKIEEINCSRLLSIIVPVYQCEEFVEKCILSLLNQTEKNIEVILIDDGSTDNSGKIVDKYAACDSRIIAIHKSNGGVSSARNIGISKATGKYIMFVDADDVIKSDMCEQLLNNALKYNSDMVVSGFILKDKNNKENYMIRPEAIYKSVYEINGDFNKLYGSFFFHNVCGKLYKTDLALKYKFKEKIRIGEDLLYNLEYLEHCINIVSIKYCGYVYVFNSNSATKKYMERDFDTQIFLRDQSQDFFRKICSCEEEDSEAINNIFIQNSLDLILNMVSQYTWKKASRNLDKILNDNKFKICISRYVPTDKKRCLIYVLCKKKKKFLLLLLGKINKIYHEVK